MADPIQVANSATQLTGKTLVTAEDSQAIEGQKVFNRAPLAPFEVESGSAVVTNLDADKLDGEHGADFHNASNLATGTVPGERIPNPLPAVSGENLTNLNAANLTGVIPGTAVPDPLPAVSGAALTAVPNPLPATSGVNLTAVPNPLPATSGVNLTALPNPLPATSGRNLTEIMALLQGFAYSSGQGNAGGGGDTELTSYGKAIPANVLDQPGDLLVISGVFALAADGNQKVAKIGIGSATPVKILDTSANVANHRVPFRVELRRRTSSVASLSGDSKQGAGPGGTATVYLINGSFTALDFTTSQTLKVFAASTTAGAVLLTDYTIAVERGLSGITV
jgi:hypothetical protein